VALSFFLGFVIIYNELKNDFMGRLELDIGRIDNEFGGINPLASTSIEKFHIFFSITWSRTVARKSPLGGLYIRVGDLILKS